MTRACPESDSERHCRQPSVTTVSHLRKTSIKIVPFTKKWIFRTFQGMERRNFSKMASSYRSGNTWVSTQRLPEAPRTKVALRAKGQLKRWRLQARGTNGGGRRCGRQPVSYSSPNNVPEFNPATYGKQSKLN